MKSAEQARLEGRNLELEEGILSDFGFLPKLGGGARPRPSSNQESDLSCSRGADPIGRAFVSENRLHHHQRPIQLLEFTKHPEIWLRFHDITPRAAELAKSSASTQPITTSRLSRCSCPCLSLLAEASSSVLGLQGARMRRCRPVGSTLR